MTFKDIALTMTPGLGVKGAVRLLECFETAEKIFGASREELIHFAQLRPAVADAIVGQRMFSAAQREVKYCEQNGIRTVASTDEEYPFLLKQAVDYPHVIYVMGNVRALQGRALSVVGTRRISSYGDRMVLETVRDLASKVDNLTIVSGLAFGVDSAAHRAAIHYDVPTVAVVANALPAVTPTQHTALAREIIECGGAIVSEYHSQTKQNGNLYISRNRIVAALSGATLVVESPISGGSMVTAQMVVGYDRLLMAIPGKVSDQNSKGCNLLIANRQALLFYGADQLIREMMWDDCAPSDRIASHQIESDLTPDQAGLLRCFRTDEPLAIDELVELTQLEASALAVLLTELELLGEIRMLPGNRYERLNVVVA